MRIIPGVQKPHWRPWWSTNACWIGMQAAALREALDRRHLGAGGLEREYGAALHRAAVDEHRAGAALARVAADVSAGQPQPVAQRMDEQRPPLDLERPSPRR